jgi:hypothetical protein
MQDDGLEGMKNFRSEGMARDEARAVAGVAILSTDPTGSATIFRGGRELEGAEAAESPAKNHARRSR